jgi:hypothetical protein
VPHTLSLIKESNENILVYTDQEGMYRFFKELSLPNVELYLRKDLNIGRNLKSIFKIHDKRSEILHLLLKKEPSTIYVFHNTFGSIENWIIKKLSKKGVKLHFFPVFNNWPFNVKYTLKSVVGIFKNYILHSVFTEPLWTGKRFIFRLPESYFRKHKAKNINLIVDEQYINTLVSEKFSLTKKEIVLLTGTVVELNQVEEQEYIMKINKLINIIGIDRIIAKPHPRFPNRYGLEKELEVIPYFIPANVLYGIFGTFIGYSSSVISEAADHKLNAISTIDYFKPVSMEIAKNYKVYLMKNSEKEIKFPKNVEEICNIIS